MLKYGQLGQSPSTLGDTHHVQGPHQFEMRVVVWATGMGS